MSLSVVVMTGLPERHRSTADALRSEKFLSSDCWSVCSIAHCSMQISADLVRAISDLRCLGRPVLTVHRSAHYVAQCAGWYIKMKHTCL